MYECLKLSFFVQVSVKRAKEWCASRGNMPYFETSAKENYNVEEAFLCAAKTAIENEHETEMYNLKNQTSLSILLIITSYNNIIIELYMIISFLQIFSGNLGNSIRTRATRGWLFVLRVQP